MRLWTPRTASWFSRLGIARPITLVLAGLLLGPTGPARGESEVPAVWVPAAPAGVGGPIVLVPYGQTLTIAEPGRAPTPWLPRYLASPDPDPFGGALRSGVLPEDLRRAGAGLQVRQGATPEAGSRNAGSQSFSAVLRDVDWRRKTARRLRAQPDFNPRF